MKLRHTVLGAKRSKQAYEICESNEAEIQVESVPHSDQNGQEYLYRRMEIVLDSNHNDSPKTH